jgi:hypothetical protein
VQPTRTRIERVVIYDDEAREVHSRRGPVERAFESIVEESLLPDVPEIELATLRPECLRAVERPGTTILLADLMSYDRSAKGARILRAISQRPDVAPRTYRVALTGRASPVVTASLTDYAHAVVVHREANAESIAEALRHVLEHEPTELSATTTFPENATAEYPLELDRALKRALGDRYTAAMAEAAFRLLSSPSQELGAVYDADGLPVWKPTNELDPAVAELAEQLPERAFNVPRAPMPITITDLYKHLRSLHYYDNAGVDPKRLFDDLKERLWTVSTAELTQFVSPEVVKVLSGKTTDRLFERTHHETWLTEEEHRLAWAFVEDAHTAIEALPKSKRSKGRDYQAVNETFQRDGYPEQVHTICYAVWTLMDWLHDRSYDRPPTAASAAALSNDA